MLQLRLGGAPTTLWFDLADSSAGAGSLLSNLQCSHSTLQPHAVGHAHQPTQPHTVLAPPPRTATLASGGKHPHRPLAQGHGAQRLGGQLHSIESSSLLRGGVLGRDEAAAAEGSGLAAPTSSGATASSAAADASFRRRLSGLVLRVGDMLQPQGEFSGDNTWGERTVNVLTSLPFLAIGWHMHRQRLTPEGKRHAVSMMCVGAAATVYHGTWGQARKLARKVDYWTIAVCSSNMVKCLYADSPAAQRAATFSLLGVPFRPFIVSCGNALIMQGEFARQATTHKAVRRDLRRHYTAAVLGLGAFFAEDLLGDSGYSGYVHAAWHVLACYGCWTMNGLLAHKERQLLQRRLRPKVAMRRPVHSSASSLPSYGSRGGRLGGCSPGTASP